MPWEGPNLPKKSPVLNSDFMGPPINYINEFSKLDKLRGPIKIKLTT